MSDDSKSNQSQTQLTIILGSILAVLLVITAGVLTNSLHERAPQGVAPPAPAAQFLPPVRITLAQFLKLDDRDSYNAAVRLLGQQYGTEISRTMIGGTTTVMYQWQNDDGSNMTAMFQNDRLVSKSQFGLK